MNIVWFKSDLRVADNPALHESMRQGQTLAVYCLTMQQWQKHGLSPAKQSLVIRQLISLEKQLNDLNVPLVIVEADTFHNVPEALSNLVAAAGVEHVFWNHEHELNERQIERKVKSLCENMRVQANCFDDSCIIPAGSIKNKQNEPYKVFTAFKRAFINEFYTKARRLYERPCAQAPVAKDLVDQVRISLSVLTTKELLEKLVRLELDKHYDIDPEKSWPAGEASALDRLQQFFTSDVESYESDRDLPYVDGTSKLSPYLAVGSLSSRQCLQEALLKNKGELLSTDPGINTWVNELIWRDFYRHLLHWYPNICKFKPFKPETDELSWSHNHELFELWKQGKTGYPIVDAGMRQLNQSGWMHNRVRMITAMFLTKHLFIDWRWGEAYFMSKLVDGDFASNNGGWQWSASTGVDAVPYFRIFNPVRQSERFDAGGDYIRTYVPELRKLDAKSIHMPTAVQALELGYVLPLVNHKEATEKTKLAFSNLNKSQALSKQAQVAIP